jgi:hypothetical protein
MSKDLPHNYTGLRVEDHLVLKGQQSCVAYRNGERVGVFYFSSLGLRLVFEEAESVSVEKRTGPAEFEQVYQQKGMR